jgi:DNA mismatch repair protein MutS2
MDEKSLHTLELPKVLDRLTARASFSASKELALGLRPVADLIEARRRLAETSEARLLLDTHSDVTVGGARDVRPQALAAARQAVLEPLALLDVKATLISARTLARFFEKAAGTYPTLTAIAVRLQPAPGLIDAISAVLDDRGEVLDSASERLAAIRREVRVVRERLLGKLQRLISDPKIVPVLQEPIITQRDGRFVVPLRAEFKGRIKSLIHDQSASGATLFVEPVGVVELNNQVRELELAERDEVRRILAELSHRVGEQLESIVMTVEALAQLDLAMAKARYAVELRASEPLLRPWETAAEGSHPGSTLRLLRARHPLLDPAAVVPVDLVLDASTYVVVITGPNTGGKTVTLKTAGLLTVMAQCGLHLPADSGSELTLFDAVYADIGDEQSIEQSLSTFSGHIAAIVNILARADSRSLVLLDELGAGTDPQEGSALARAILLRLLTRKATTLVATHYPELKSFAQTTPGVRNASVEFDLETLRPTFRLTIGLPGRSNALAIAERLGLDGSLLEEAREMIDPQERRADLLLDELHRERETARRERLQAEESAGEARNLRAELARRLDAMQEERRELLEAARRTAADEVESVRRELAEVRRQLAAAAQPLTALEQAKARLDDLEEATAEPVARAEQADRERPRPELRLGDRVWLPTLGAEGVITELALEQAEVQIGRLRVRARREELELPAPVVEGEGITSARQPRIVRRAVTALGSLAALEAAPPLELDLRGLTVDEALEQLERRLDAAFLAGLPFVRIIHGRGTGRLRLAIRQALKGNSYVSRAEAGGEAEGGDGVTVVHLESRL